MVKTSCFMCAQSACPLFLALLFCLMPFAPGKALAGAPEPPILEIWKAGDITITAIQDMPGAMPPDIFKGPASVEQKKPFFPGGKAEAGFNVFLMRAKNMIVLFDSGNGSTRDTPGRLPELLAALGVTPEAVDLVLLTHMHTDHVGGLIKNGERVFPRAKIAVAKPEIDYWLGLAEKGSSNANAALIKSIAVAYGKDMLTSFAFGDAPLPGVVALNAAGHTPGHTVFRVDADGKSLLIIGDLLHAVPLQLALPDECAVYDMDMPAAVASRKRILEMGVEGKMPVAGMHMPFPGGGPVARDSQASYMLKRQ